MVRRAARGPEAPPRGRLQKSRPAPLSLADAPVRLRGGRDLLERAGLPLLRRRGRGKRGRAGVRAAHHDVARRRLRRRRGRRLVSGPGAPLRRRGLGGAGEARGDHAGADLLRARAGDARDRTAGARGRLALPGRREVRRRVRPERGARAAVLPPGRGPDERDADRRALLLRLEGHLDALAPDAGRLRRHASLLRPLRGGARRRPRPGPLLRDGAPPDLPPRNLLGAPPSLPGTPAPDPRAAEDGPPHGAARLGRVARAGALEPAGSSSSNSRSWGAGSTSSPCCCSGPCAFPDSRSGPRP